MADNEQKSFSVTTDGDSKTVESVSIDLGKRWQHMHMSYDPNSGTVIVTGFNDYKDVQKFWGFDDQAGAGKARPGDIIEDKSCAVTVVCF